MTRRSALARHTCLLAGTGALAFALVAASPAPAADLRIGLEAPLSGPDAVFGAQLRQGAKLAIEDLDASGGFLGEHATLVLGDDVDDPKRGADVARRFVDEKIRFVVGPFSSSVTLPATAIYGAAGTLAITPSATAPQVTDRGLPAIFRLGAREDRQSAVAARYLAARHQRIAILHDKTSSGKALADAVRKALAADSVTEVLYAGVDKGAKDFTGLVNRLKAAHAQIAFWGGTQVEAGLLARQLHDANSPVTLMGGAGIASDEFAALAGPAAEGTLMVFPQDPAQRPQAAALLKRLRSAAIEPDAYVFYAYAAVEVLAQAMNAAHSIDPAAVAKAMHGGMVFKTVLGDIAFDEKGDLIAPDYAVTTWHRSPTGRMGF